MSVSVWGDGTVHRVWCNTVEEEGLKGMFHVSGTGRGSDEAMRGVCELEGAGEELGGEQGEVVADWEDLGFRVKMGDRSHLHAASSYAEGSVLEGL